MSPYSDLDGNASSFISSSSGLSQENIHLNQSHHNSHLHSRQKHHNSRYHHPFQHTQSHSNYNNSHNINIHNPQLLHNYNHNAKSTNSNNIVKYLIASEFDINLGPVIRQQYPSPIPSDNLPYFAELLMPDQIHTRSEDWTVVILHKDKQSGEYRYGSSSGSVTHPNSSTDSLTTTASTLYTHKTKEKGNTSHNKEKYHENGNEEEDQNDDDQPLYILNVVNTRFNQKVHRNTIIKGIAIATTSHYFQMFKPLLLVALDQLFHITTTTTSTLNPSPNNTYDDAYVPVLRNLYDSVNAIDIHGIVPRFLLERKLLLNSIIDFPIKECFSNKNFSSKMFESAVNSGINHKDYAKRELFQHMKIKDNATIEVLINYLNFKIPLRIPFLQMPEIVGDFSVRDLVSNLLYAKVVINKGKTNQTKNGSTENDSKANDTKNISTNVPPYPELLVYGESTPAIVVLINAFLTHKKILYLGNKTPALAICEAVFATIALISGGGGLLRGFLKQTYPYIDLSKFEFIEQQDWYFAGTANPTFKAHERLYDVLYDMELNELVLSRENGYCMQEAIIRSRNININDTLMSSLNNNSDSINNNSDSINNNNDYNLSSPLAPIESDSSTFSAYANQLDVSEEEENDKLEQVRSPSSIISMPFSNNTTANSGYAFATASNPFRSVSGHNLTIASSPRVVLSSKSMNDSTVAQKPTPTTTSTSSIFARPRQNSGPFTNNHKTGANDSNSNTNNNAIILEDANLLKKLTILIREKHDDETIIMAFRQHINEIMRILQSVDQLDKQKKQLLLGPFQGLELSDLIGFMLREPLPQSHTVATTPTHMKRKRPLVQLRSFSFESRSSLLMPSSPTATNGNANRFKFSPLSSPTEASKSFNQQLQHQQSQHQQSQHQHQNQVRHSSSSLPFNSSFKFSTNNGSSSHGGLKINRNSGSSANKYTRVNTNSTNTATTKANNGMHAKNESMNSFASNTTFSSSTNTANNSNSNSNSKHSSMTTNDSSVANGYGNYGNGKGFANYGVISEGDDNDHDSYNENNNDNYNDNNGQSMVSISANTANTANTANINNNNSNTAAWRPNLINSKYSDSSIHSNFNNSQHSRQYINNSSHNYNQNYNHHYRQNGNTNFYFDNDNNQVSSPRPANIPHSYHNQNNNSNSNSGNKRSSGGIVGLNFDLNFENGYFWNSKKEKLSEIKTYYWVYKGYKYAPQIFYNKKDDESLKNCHLQEHVQDQREAQDQFHFRNPISYFFQNGATVELNAVYGNSTYAENNNDDNRVKSAVNNIGNASQQDSSPHSVKGDKNSYIYNNTRDAININKTGSSNYKSKTIKKTVDIAYHLSMLQNSMTQISDAKSLEIYLYILAYLTSSSLSVIDSTSSPTSATTTLSTEKLSSLIISESSSASSSNDNNNGNGNSNGNGTNANQKPSALETEEKVERFLIMTYLLSSNSHNTAAATTSTANIDDFGIGSSAKNKGIEMIYNGLYHRDSRVKQKVVEILNLITRELVLGKVIIKNGINPFFKMAWDEQQQQQQQQR